MQFTSYGDIIGIYYNEESNPTPNLGNEIFLTENNIQTSTQQILKYPFNKLGKICADKKKNWFVVDSLPPERQEFDEKSKLALRQVVLRFSEDGNFIDYFGQEGPGGTPFPFIREIYTTLNNELVVISQSTNGQIAYWFSDAGFLKYTIPVEIENLPKLADIPTEDLFISLDTIIPDRKEQILYIKVDYQRRTFDTSTKAVAGIKFVATYLYPLDIEKGFYADSLLIPAHEYTITEGFSKSTQNIPYDFFGVSENGWLFFMLADENGFLVQLVQLNGQRVLNRRINMDFENTKYYNFNLSDEGIISAIQILKDNAKVSWWRTDNLIESLLK